MQYAQTGAPVIEIRDLTRRFGGKKALDQVNLSIPEGAVFGLVGTNGAGKTTLIKHVMGLLAPESGSVSVFGLDPISEPTCVLSRIGYLSESNDLPEWMRGEQLLRFLQTFYPTWDDDYADSLQRSFELDLDKPIKGLSKGQRARLALVCALAYRPDILVLDEPSSGLDPLVRRDILRAIIRTIADEGRTVLFSSHLLDEVERVADHVAIIENGKVLECDRLDALKGEFHRLTLQFEHDAPQTPYADGCLGWQGSGSHWSTLYRGPQQEVDRLRETLDASIVDRAVPTLNEIFVGLIEREHERMGAHQ